MGPESGPLPSLKASELWAPVLKVFTLGFTRGPYWETRGSTLDGELRCGFLG